MKRRKIFQQDGLEIPMTPLIDIVFLLLIYFMLASHFVNQHGLKVKLPESSSGITHTNKSILTLTVTKDGTFFLDGKEVSDAVLTASIRSHIAGLQEPKCRINADRDAPFRTIIKAIDSAKEAGIESVILETKGISTLRDHGYNKAGS